MKILTHRLAHATFVLADSCFSLQCGGSDLWAVKTQKRRSVWPTSVFVCRPGQRTGDDLEIIYDELLHIKALAHLSNTVSQLARLWSKPDEDGRPGLRGTHWEALILQCQIQPPVYVETSRDHEEILCCNVMILSSQNKQIIEQADMYKAFLL